MKLKMVEIDDKQVFAILQQVKQTGTLKIGVNEVTKSVERKQAKLVVTATDVSPAEIVAHFPLLCKEIGIIHIQLGTKQELGECIGIKSTSSLAIIDEGAAKKDLDGLLSSLKEEEETEEKEEEKKDGEE